MLPRNLLFTPQSGMFLLLQEQYVSPWNLTLDSTLLCYQDGLL